MKFFKALIKTVLRWFGLGTYNLKRGQRRTMAESLAQLRARSFSPKTVIDVGVAYGTQPLYETFPQAAHLLIEPLEEYKSVLDRIARQYHAQYEIAAAGAAPGMIEINVHPDLSGSSLLREAEGGGVDGVPRRVKMITLDDACRERGLSGPYLIKVDTQGAELTVLAGAQKILAETEVIVLEVSFFPFYHQGPQFHDIVAWMKAHGFVAYDLFGGQNRPLDGALAQTDMVFVRETSALRKDHHYATPAQRARHTKIVSAENPKT